MLKNFWKNESGQGMVEYGLIIALIAVVVIVALGSLGGSIKTIFNNAAETLKDPKKAADEALADGADGAGTSGEH